MRSSTSSFEGYRRCRSCRATAVAFVLFVAFVVILEGVYRWAGALPSVSPGPTRDEFVWKIQHTDLSRAVVMVGDSRVAWGFAERPFEKALRAQDPRLASLVAVNAGLPATSVEAEIRYLTRATEGSTGGWLLVNYSSAGFYFFDDGFLDACPLHITLQEHLDDQLRNALQSSLLTWQEDPRRIRSLVRDALRGSPSADARYVERTFDPDGFFGGRLASANGPVDARIFEMQHYQRIIENITAQPEAARLRLRQLREAIQGAREHGWRMMLVRLPVDEELIALESRLPPDLRFDRAAATLNLIALDFCKSNHTARFITSDGSHLTATAARALAPFLALELARLLKVTLATPP